MKRIPPFKTLDAFRGLAAIWVLMYHSCSRWLPDGNSPYLREPLYAVSILGQLGVMIFFVISGYCITAAAYGALVSGKTVGRYSFERIRRIYPPYFAALILSALSILVVEFISSHHYFGQVHHVNSLPLDWRYWVGNTFLLQYELNTPMINGVFWSLGYEVAFYLIVGVLLLAARWVVKSRGIHAGTLFLVSSMGVCTMATVGWLLYSPSPIFPIDGWHYFALGGLLFFVLELNEETAEKYTKALRVTAVANLVIVTSLMLLLAAYRTVGGSDFAHPSSKVRVIACLAFAVLLIGLKRFDETVSANLLMKPFMWVGVFSYSLYLIHPIVLPYLDIVGRKAGFDGSRYWITFWSEVVVGLIFGRIFFLMVEKRFISKRQVQRIVTEHVGLVENAS